jgi:hypothetical protein
LPGPDFPGVEKESAVIKPTVGRVVWYRPFEHDDMAGVSGDQPLAAIVAHVWSDSCVNLAVFDANGVAHSRTSVLLVQDGEPKPAAGFCEWMPYQKGQAAKTEAVEKQLADVGTHAKLTDGDIEAMIQATGKTAPRITPADIEANIAGEFYINPHDATLDALRFQFLMDDHGDAEIRGKVRTIHERMGVMSTAAVRNEIDEMMAIPGEDTTPLRLLTFCVLVLRNGFTVTGQSACVSPENFDAEIGRRVAREDAIRQVWPLMGYALAEKLRGAQA